MEISDLESDLQKFIEEHDFVNLEVDWKQITYTALM